MWLKHLVLLTAVLAEELQTPFTHGLRLGVVAADGVAAIPLEERVPEFPTLGKPSFVHWGRQARGSHQSSDESSQKAADQRTGLLSGLLSRLSFGFSAESSEESTEAGPSEAGPSEASAKLTGMYRPAAFEIRAPSFWKKANALQRDRLEKNIDYEGNVHNATAAVVGTADVGTAAVVGTAVVGTADGTSEPNMTQHRRLPESEQSNDETADERPDDKTPNGMRSSGERSGGEPSIFEAGIRFHSARGEGAGRRRLAEAPRGPLRGLFPFFGESVEGKRVEGKRVEGKSVEGLRDENAAGDESTEEELDTTTEQVDTTGEPPATTEPFTPGTGITFAYAADLPDLRPMRPGSINGLNRGISGRWQDYWSDNRDMQVLKSMRDAWRRNALLREVAFAKANFPEALAVRADGNQLFRDSTIPASTTTQTEWIPMPSSGNWGRLRALVAESSMAGSKWPSNGAGHMVEKVRPKFVESRVVQPLRNDQQVKGNYLQKGNSQEKGSYLNKETISETRSVTRSRLGLKGQQDAEQSTDQAAEQAAEQSTEQSAERFTEQYAAQSAEQYGVQSAAGDKEKAAGEKEKVAGDKERVAGEKRVQNSMVMSLRNEEATTAAAVAVAAGGGVGSTSTSKLRATYSSGQNIWLPDPASLYAPTMPTPGWRTDKTYPGRLIFKGDFVIPDWYNTEQIATQKQPFQVNEPVLAFKAQPYHGLEGSDRNYAFRDASLHPPQVPAFNKGWKPKRVYDSYY
ncbi:hypothetical protein GNI_116860 [Gregarina niphandrodes]|uniref:Uncharacterized protein n=1 Tax=Gregarina niphandrodes TaxID=110365 RepID=A0A023B2Q0_GRENI|nr:hypothetical protein GNI_116860 [Gregarina niphandrodes]EZG55158.1 hypothetical protein GNI_116860 [Gregarina niphandrodes]|eukprot:XP_011131746.1 hypothetical protein GNI_116860 [Gregarina niphandrodes]